MWYWFFVSLAAYLILASMVRPKDLDLSSVKGAEWDNRMITGVMIIIALWIAGGIIYRIQNPICESDGVQCSHVDYNEDQNGPDYFDSQIRSQ